jgi:hypothetical protein
MEAEAINSAYAGRRWWRSCFNGDIRHCWKKRCVASVSCTHLLLLAWFY